MDGKFQKKMGIIFSKKHHNKAKYFSDDILKEFLTKYLNSKV